MLSGRARRTAYRTDCVDAISREHGMHAAYDFVSEGAPTESIPQFSKRLRSIGPVQRCLRTTRSTGCPDRSVRQPASWR